MELLLGRRLRRNEVVHHKNHITTDNRPENLELLNKRVHNLLHHPPIYPLTKTCVMCGAVFTPHKTKRKRNQTCGAVCGHALSVQSRLRNKAARYR